MATTCETDSSSRYPVVYLLDANWNFEPVRDLVRSLASEGEIEPVILVSVCPVQALQPGYGGTAPARPFQGRRGSAEPPCRFGGLAYASVRERVREPLRRSRDLVMMM